MNIQPACGLPAASGQTVRQLKYIEFLSDQPNVAAMNQSLGNPIKIKRVPPPDIGVQQFQDRSYVQ